jgi:ankyrin repeat protein
LIFTQMAPPTEDDLALNQACRNPASAAAQRFLTWLRALPDEQKVRQLCRYSQNDCGHVVSLMIANGTAVNAASGDGDQRHTALMFAASEGAVRSTRALLHGGADHSLSGVRGFTPLHVASMRGHADLVQLLLSRGAQLEMRTAQGFTPLMYGGQEGHLAVCQLLVQAGAEVNAVNHGGSAPLLFAPREGHLGILCYLLKHGANPNLQDAFGNTALTQAIMHGKALCVRALVGVTDLALRDSFGRSSNVRF